MVPELIWSHGLAARGGLHSPSAIQRSSGRRLLNSKALILREGFSEESPRSFEAQSGSACKGTEWLMNHLHIADTYHYGCPDISKDKIVLLGNVLEEIYETKLRAVLPERPCIVEFYVPENEDDLVECQLSFWQAAHGG